MLSENALTTSLTKAIDITINTNNIYVPNLALTNVKLLFIVINAKKIDDFLIIK